MFYCAGHTAIAATLHDRPTCVDLGFNRGEFTRFLVGRYKVPVHAAEPVRSLVESAPEIPGLTLYNVAIGGEDGEVSINVFGNRCASIYKSDGAVGIHSEDVELWSLETLWSHLPEGEIGLVKVDIEGAEFGMFQSASTETLRRARQYIVEFHDFLWKEREMDVVKAIAKLESAGFVTLKFSRDNSNVVFIRRDWLFCGRLGRIWLMGPVKYGMGIYRILVRCFTSLKQRT